MSQFPLALTATNSQYGHNTQQTKILLLLKCIGASDWSRDWWTTNQNDCLILSYDVLSVSWELRKHKVHCTLSHYPTCTWILTIKMISKLPVSPKFGRSWIKQLRWGKEWVVLSFVYLLSYVTQNWQQVWLFLKQNTYFSGCLA